MLVLDQYVTLLPCDGSDQRSVRIIQLSEHSLDNDPSGTGERVAREADKPYWISPTIGQDFNDYWSQEGTFKASQSLKKFLLTNAYA